MKSYLITSFWWHDPADSSRFFGSFNLGTSTHHSSNRRMESTEHQPHSAAGHSTKMEFYGIWELKSTWGSGYVTFGWFDMIWSTCVFFDISGVTTMSCTTRGFFHMDRTTGRKFSWNWSSNAATAKDCESQHRKNELNKSATSSVIFN